MAWISWDGSKNHLHFNKPATECGIYFIDIEQMELFGEKYKSGKTIAGFNDDQPKCLNCLRVQNAYMLDDFGERIIK